MSNPTTAPAVGVGAKIAAVTARYAAARRQLDLSKAEEIARLQAECGEIGHRLKLHQVAGDGRYCEICGITVPEED